LLAEDTHPEHLPRLPDCRLPDAARYADRRSKFILPFERIISEANTTVFQGKRGYLTILFWFSYVKIWFFPEVPIEKMEICQKDKNRH